MSVRPFKYHGNRSPTRQYCFAQLLHDGIELLNDPAFVFW
jgi:hypothetical protein